MSTTKWRWSVNQEPNETSMYGSCEILCNVAPLKLLQGVFHIRKLPVANLTKRESSKTLHLVVLMGSWYS